MYSLILASCKSGVVMNRKTLA